MIWKTPTHPRIQFLIWRIYNNSFPTTEKLFHLSSLEVLTYNFYTQVIEIITHVLKDCLLVKCLPFWYLKLRTDHLISVESPTKCLAPPLIGRCWGAHQRIQTPLGHGCSHRDNIWSFLYERSYNNPSQGFVHFYYPYRLILSLYLSIIINGVFGTQKKKIKREIIEMKVKYFTKISQFLFFLRESLIFLKELIWTISHYLSFSLTSLLLPH